MVKKRGKSSSESISKYNGIKVLTIYTIFLALVYLMFTVTNQTVMFFGYVLEGGIAVIINILFIAIIFSIIHGLMTRGKSIWYLAIAWFGFEIFNSIISMYIQTEGFNIIHDIILGAFGFIILIDALIIWYLIEIKDAFMHGKHDIKHDKLFIRTLTVLMSLAVIVTIIFAAYHYTKITQETDKMIDQLRLKTYSQAKDICESKIGSEKDICFLTLAAMYKEALPIICENIDSTFYKFTCIRATK